MALSRQQKILIFKVSALLSLVRWYNIFFLALAQYLAVIFILNEPGQWFHLITDPKVHYIVFASLFSVAGGYIINNFYDLERDLINRPEKTLYEKILKQSTTLRLYFVFTIAGAFFALLVSVNVFLFFSAFNFVLWFYSHKLKKVTFVGNLIAALLSITPFFAIFLYFHLQDLLILSYISFILLIIFIREIIKDLEAFKGDIILGYSTLPVRLGISKTKWLVIAFTVLGIAPCAAIFYKTNFTGISYYMVLGLLGLALGAGLIAFAEKPKHYHYINHLYRFMIIMGIFGLILFSINYQL